MEEFNYTVIPGRRSGSKIYCHDDKGYIVDKIKGEKENPSKMNLRCQHSGKQGCKARATIKLGLLKVATKHPHSCADSTRDWILNHFKELMKSRARTESTPLKVRVRF